jgi:hypothetical protein
MGSPTQSQMGGGFGGQQSPMLQKPMQPMQPQMPQQNLGGFGGGDMGMFQDSMRQQQASQMPQQPAYGGFGNGMGINIAQPPQQSGGLLGSLSPQQNPGGFGNQQQSQLQQALQSFRGQQQMPQSGIHAMPQQDMLNAQQQALAQMPQMPQMPQAQRDEYNRLSAMSPEQRFSTLINQMGPEERGQYNAGIQQAAQDPSTQRQYDAFRSGQGQNMDPNLVRAIEVLRSAAPQQSGFGGQPQMPMMPQPMVTVDDAPPLMRDSGPMPAVPYSQRQRHLPLRAPQQVRPEPPRMQAMRGIQQLASRQRGYNR